MQNMFHHSPLFRISFCLAFILSAFLRWPVFFLGILRKLKGYYLYNYLFKTITLMCIFSCHAFKFFPLLSFWSRHRLLHKINRFNFLKSVVWTITNLEKIDEKLKILIFSIILVKLPILLLIDILRNLWHFLFYLILKAYIEIVSLKFYIIQLNL